MTKLREVRNEAIRVMFIQMRHAGLRVFDCIDKIEQSEENKKWCLGWDRLRVIATSKDDGELNVEK